MSSAFSKIRDLLEETPWQKAKELAEQLGLTRKEVNAVLYSDDNHFSQNDAYEWSVGDPAGLSDTAVHTISEGRLTAYDVISTIKVDGVDTVERIKEALKEKPFQKVSALAAKVGEKRKLVNRTLRSFTNVFSKNDKNEWSVKSDYIDATTGPDADFVDIGAASKSASQLPSADFEEQDKPPQQAVIEARLDRNFLVLAPPGTGKTHTLIERLVYVTTKSYREVDAGELLVLSFTRAAVGEVRERIAKAIVNGAPSSLRYVQVKTFDAYATWLLSDGGYDIAGKSYGSRIDLLTSELKNVRLRQTTGRISRSRYLFVDEIQDLVGMRADMVFELVKRILASKGSVTLLGDPHQSLNDYQIRGQQTKSSEFLAKVQGFLSGRLERFELEESHRYQTKAMKELAAEAKRVLDCNVRSATEKFNSLVKLIPKISDDQLLECFKKNEIDALLCRTNGEVYQWLNWQDEQGNSCKVNAGAVGRPWPCWIGSAIMHYQPELITRDHLLHRLNDMEESGFSCKEEELDKFLANERLLGTGTINLKDLAFRLKYLSPALKGDTLDGSLIISTVHKAKGLEYSNVVVVEPRSKKISDEEVRVLYVAITRAKRSIRFLAADQKPFSGWMKKKKGGHLGYSENGGKYLQVLGFEDFDLETLFIDEKGVVDTENLEKYLLCYQESASYCIRPETCNEENDHNYALYLNSSLGSLKLCAVGENMKKSLDAMSWGNKFGEDGAMLDIGDGCGYQTMVHPMESTSLARIIGPSGIMVFPLIQGFYPLSRAIGE